jgi:glyoxylase I family protein
LIALSKGVEMSIEHLPAVVPVTDVKRSCRWYEMLFGRAADNNPMPNLVEWQVVPGGWVQVFTDDEHAGSTVVNLAVQDLTAHVEELRRRGLEAGEVVEANKGVQLSALTDPDGNKVWLIGGFRVRY